MDELPGVLCSIITDLTTENRSRCKVNVDTETWNTFSFSKKKKITQNRSALEGGIATFAI